MALSLPSKARQLPLLRSRGSLLGLVSLLLHGVLLGLPIAAPEEQTPAAAPEPPTALMDVVRLPPGAVPGPDSQPAAAAPQPQAAARPLAPVAPQPAASAPTDPAADPVPETQASGNQAPDAIAPDAIAPLPAEPPPLTLDERLRDPAAYAFNNEAKSLIADEANFHMAVVPGWLERESRGLADADIPLLGTKLAPLQVVAPVNTCLSPLPAEGLVGVIVSATGELLKEPELLDSTGYSVLDEKALDMARSHAFAPFGSGGPNPYAHWLPIQVQYSAVACPL